MQPLGKHYAIRKENQSKYPCAPSWEQIHAFLKEIGMKSIQFERFYGIPYNTLTQVKMGTKKIPVYAWHYIYEKIKPNFGAGFLADYKKARPDFPAQNHKKKKKKIETPDFHNRLAEIK